MAVGTKEIGMHDIYDPQRTGNLHRYKTPGQRVHGWPGGIHDERTDSLSLLHDPDAKRSAEATKHQLRGFMVGTLKGFMVKEAGVSGDAVCTRPGTSR